MADEILIHVVVPEPVGRHLQQTTDSGLEIESVRHDGEQTSRFGLVEVMTVIGFVKGVGEVVKLALDIRKLLSESGQSSAQIQVPGSVSHIEVTATATDADLERRVREYMFGDGASV
jgi:hypothetical protein